MLSVNALLHTRVTHHVVRGLAGSASAGNLLEGEVSGLTLDLQNQNLHLNKSTLESCMGRLRIPGRTILCQQVLPLLARGMNCSLFFWSQSLQLQGMRSAKSCNPSTTHFNLSTVHSPVGLFKILTQERLLDAYVSAFHCLIEIHTQNYGLKLRLLPFQEATGKKKEKET